MPWAPSQAEPSADCTPVRRNTRKASRPAHHQPEAPSEQRPHKKLRQQFPRSTRANPFPKVTGPFCRLPLPALIISSRGCSPWGPDAVIGTLRRGVLHTTHHPAPLPPPKKERQKRDRACAASRQFFKVRRWRTGRRKNPGAMPDCTCFARQADSTQYTQTVKQKRQLCPVPKPASLPQKCVTASTSVCRNLNLLPFRR